MIQNLYSKFSTIFTVVGCTVCFSVAIYFIYIKPPGFGQTIQDNLTNNQTLMQKIGGWDTAEFFFNDDKPLNNSFYVKVNGHCKGAFIKVSGVYSENSYTVTDSTISLCR